MAPQKGKKTHKDAARKEKIDAKRKEAREAKAPIERDESKKPARDHWLMPKSYTSIPAVYCLGIPSGDELQPVENIIELLVKERGAMIILENNTNDIFKKKLQEALQEAKDKANSGIARQFRKASVHVHPDRHGDEYMYEFDRLKSAYQIMKDPEVRKDYLDHMLHQVLIYETDPRIRITMPTFFEHMHEVWHEKHKKKQEQDTAHARYQQQQQDGRKNNEFRSTAGPQQHYYLDASERMKQPGHSSIYKRNAEDRTIILAMHFRNSEDLFHFLYEVVITAWPVEDEADTVEIKRLTREDLKSILYEKKEDEGSHRVFQVPLEFDENCKWCLQWHVVLNIPDLDDPYTHTASTRRLVFDLQHPAFKRSKHEYPILLRMAKVDASELSGFCRKLVSQESNNPQILEAESWQLHRLLSRGRSTGRRLHTCLEILGYSIEKCDALELLIKACEEAVHAKSVLDQHVFAGQKKNALKSFKQSVATMIESGELSEWLDKVQMEQLKNHGGEANRLFQLLVEGKKANSLLVDATALRKAANRFDLFSEKQCQTLLERAVQADEQLAIETDRLVKEEQEKKKEEALRSRLEARAKGMPLRGSEVELFGLQNRSDLNGSVGWYMGIATTTEDRYIVKLFDGSEVSLKKSNFRLYDGRSEVGLGSTATAAATPPRPSKASGSKSTPSPNRRTKAGAKSSSPSKSSLSAKSPPPKPPPKPSPPRKSPPPKPSPSEKPPPSNAWQTEESSAAHMPPHRKQATWILQDQTASFIGKRGAHVRKLLAETKVQHIKVMEEDIYLATDGRKWVSVKVGGKTDLTLNAIKIINQWVEEHDSKGNPKAVPNDKNKGAKRSPPITVDTEPSQTPSSQAKSQSNSKQNETKTIKTSPRNVAPSPTSTMDPVEDSAREHSTEGNVQHQVQQENPHHIPTYAGVRPIGPPPTNRSTMQAVNLASALQIGQKAASESPATAMHRLMEFLTEQAASFKVSPIVFFDYLQSMDIEHMGDLAEAVEDDDIMSDFVDNGLKKFKKGSLKKAVLAIVTPKPSPFSIMAASSIPGLMEFLTNHAASFKGTPKDFFDYLGSMDIEGMRDLAEAVEDDDVMLDFTNNGLKKFKKGSFKNAVLAIETFKASMIPNGNPALSRDTATPDGLTCPISFQLMSNDPVLAADGMTYERAVIEEWFQRNQGLECILSPMTGEPLANLYLQPNIAVRTMAREYERSTQVGQY